MGKNRNRRTQYGRSEFRNPIRNKRPTSLPGPHGDSRTCPTRGLTNTPPPTTGVDDSKQKNTFVGTSEFDLYESSLHHGGEERVKCRHGRETPHPKSTISHKLETYGQNFDSSVFKSPSLLPNHRVGSGLEDLSVYCRHSSPGTLEIEGESRPLCLWSIPPTVKTTGTKTPNKSPEVV